MDNGNPAGISSVTTSTPESTANNIVWHQATVSRRDRAALRGHGSAILWFTGLSGSGKSSLANGVNGELHRRGVAGYVLDGDNVRHGLCRDLGFTDADRIENIRRIGEVAKLFLDAGVITLTAFVSPFQADRDRARSLVPPGDFLEIYCAADLTTCERRDPKGLYAKARAGRIKHFTGLDSPYEPPHNPELVIQTGDGPLQEGIDQVLSALEQRRLIPSLPA
ncbi:MAG: adenylyl-sulfate kinase [Synechococcus sp. SB0662_bin_45]|nr:adenylyl-sulfate kinase [Synechococcus sp. SB0668_bin_13]MXX08554.1 adenylyl-sulfate kinase [Synechococcus sp. SB0667_bin_8]MXY18694.1 adenylyl-sulfate kinase [Synechococcus sp. SB0664_bin_36]MYE22160.1 adenylyl-sulfate kinase [Synechococcus sp. SB0662_bin_45]MYG63874.1 adenylyl-sulfate kinase [Synechococcus sp. SB0675_bin_7]MYI71735.1 adenylyl-sulfate kinase [Synechococcus sp. SB0673_bin_10]MYK06850.1 adenylyl-sulfate kinase [Synechococcus sp. SB0670_bin_20]MYK86714.1 adenylyl-sulfate ki